jgi:ATP-binding cassette subfamily C protein
MARDSSSAGQAMRDFDTIRSGMSAPVVAALFDAPWTPIFLLVAFLMHFWIGILAVIAAASLVTLAWLNQRATRAKMEVASSAMAAAHASQQAAAVHGSTVRALGMLEAMVARQLHHRRTALANQVEAQFAGGRITASSRFFRLFIQSAALGLGALLAIDGDLSAGAIIASSVLVSRALQPIESIIGAWSTLASVSAATRRLAPILESIADQRIHTLLPAPLGRIDVQGVAVRAPEGQPILVGISFAVEPGQVLGIVGPSGSGKTTLGRILVGAIEPTIGDVRIDGAKFSDWDQDAIGKHIGYVPQEPSLFEGTIKENIARFARPGADQSTAEMDEAVVRAAERAGVHELILSFGQGYDTRLGLGGSGLSAGQAQRIALARALYGDPTILVLDEPNAFMDAEGECALVAAIEAARARQATVIVIAHRRGILDAADRLLVIEQGRPKLFGPAREVFGRLAAPPSAENAA